MAVPFYVIRTVLPSVLLRFQVETSCQRLQRGKNIMKHTPLERCEESRAIKFWQARHDPAEEYNTFTVLTVGPMRLHLVAGLLAGLKLPPASDWVWLEKIS